ncbi:hypothetical protein M4578_05515 [Salipiger sp. P9]|uniref:hypothetical protein n=1 Tax=Salipiger pentaromativorans TaxID=2943193 RepID=UPI002157ABF6|nr:hypothetical protein [Salipiger pentaromativorans]MCR8547276.1 hypothetical protein [Salipiger pentaromativorans]
MTQIDELQSRITRALDRIAQGVEHLSTLPPPAPEAAPETEPVEAVEVAAVPDAEAAEEIARLRMALDEEKMANAQLEERVKLLHARLEGQGGAEPAPEPDAALREQIAAQRESMAELDTELQRMRLSNEMLRRTNEDMRAALEANIGEPHLVNKAMLAELESLRAARAAEEAEMRAVLGALEPVLADAAGMSEEAVQ